MKNEKMMVALLSILLAGSTCLNSISAVKAFDLGYHWDKCAEIGAQLGLSDAAIKKLRVGDLGVDVASVLAMAFLYGKTTKELLDKMHFDDLFNYSAIKANWDSLEFFEPAIKALAGAGKWDETLIAIGQFLHAIEDFYCHSNWVVLCEHFIPKLPLPTWEQVQAAQNGPLKQFRTFLEGDEEMLQTGAWHTKLTKSDRYEHHRRMHDEINNDNEAQPNFQMAYNLSVKASFDWINTIKGWIGDDAWHSLQNYHLGWLSELWYDAKLWIWEVLAKAIGKWKTGADSTISGTGFNVTPRYEDSSSIPLYYYPVGNTGTTNINTFSITMRAGGLSYVIGLTFPDQWSNSSFPGNDTIVFHTVTAPIEPGHEETFGIMANYSYVQNCSLTINGNASLQCIGPGPPDDIDSEFIGIIESFNPNGDGGDVNGDGVVNAQDLGYMARSIFMNSSDPHGTDWGQYNPCCDLNNDGVVDLFDLAVTTTNYGKVIV